ncbi:hypothetical protein [Knoellia sp. LjRoot47]|uniref:hypothetical protein n=1 Tax=Knoellia sp. LjRoot47 TaxID=3342330 RepID=UPI003ECD8AFB
MTKALSITSTRHAAAITLYVVLTWLGLLHILDVAGHEWVTAKLGGPLTALWASLYFIGPAVVLASAMLAPTVRLPVIPLWCEAAGCVLTAAMNIVLVTCVVLVIGFDSASNFTTIFGGIVVGMLARVGQIWREQKKLKAAHAHPRPADPAPLAEADTTRE